MGRRLEGWEGNTYIPMPFHDLGRLPCRAYEWVAGRRERAYVHEQALVSL